MLLAAGLVVGGRRERLASMGLLVCWVVVPVLALFLITLFRPLFTVRYLIFVLPAFLVLLATGAQAIARHSRLLAAMLLVTLLAIQGRGIWLQARTPLKADFRAATGYIRDRLASGDLILFQIPYGRHSFEYYFEARSSSEPAAGAFQVFVPLVAGEGQAAYRWAEGLYTNGGMDWREVHRRMGQITAGSRQVWLVATEVSLWDERGLVQAWLDQYGVLVDEEQFVRVAVFRYELP
jgi:hypothetical protein